MENNRDLSYLIVDIIGYTNILSISRYTIYWGKKQNYKINTYRQVKKLKLFPQAALLIVKGPQVYFLNQYF